MATPLFLIKSLRHETKNFLSLVVFAVTVLIFVQKYLKAHEKKCVSSQDFCRQKTKLLQIIAKIARNIDICTFCVADQL